MTCLTEYNEAETMQMFKDEAYRKGHEEGIELGREEGIVQGREEGIVQGREEGIELGIEQGDEARARKDAERMYADGMSVSLIAKYVDEPEDIVRNWLE